MPEGNFVERKPGSKPVVNTQTYRTAQEREAELIENEKLDFFAKSEDNKEPLYKDEPKKDAAQPIERVLKFFVQTDSE